MFSYRKNKDNSIQIYRENQPVTILRKQKAKAFLDEAELMSESELQEVLARITGNYKRGNERDARLHPRNR
ncbi:MAG: hypothetical protein SCALA702_20980 [Melioribacteraceae bacterium]|nr:MAG: hypothetical protein SCALA702_20980 [Melioribacteraceae bacterium]